MSASSPAQAGLHVRGPAGAVLQGGIMCIPACHFRCTSPWVCTTRKAWYAPRGTRVPNVLTCNHTHAFHLPWSSPCCHAMCDAHHQDTFSQYPCRRSGVPVPALGVTSPQAPSLSGLLLQRRHCDCRRSTMVTQTPGGRAPPCWRRLTTWPGEHLHCCHVMRERRWHHVL